MRVLRRIAGMVRNPAKTFDEVKDERFRRALLYLLVLLLPVALLLVVASLIVVPIFLAYQLGDSKYLGWVGIGALAPLVVVSGFVTVLLAGLILHPFLRLLGGKQGLRRTMQTVTYGSTPLVLSLWFVPAVVITAPWSFVLTVVGLRRLQEMTTARAVIAMLLPLLVLLGIAIAAGLVFW